MIVADSPDMKEAPAKKGKDTDLEAIRKRFDMCRDAEAHNRQTALEDIKFARLGEQWPDEILKVRQTEQRPALTINKLPAFIRQVVNDSRQNKPSITVKPVDSKADPETAEVLSGLVRNIEYTSSADVAYDTAVEQAVSSGFGYWRVSIDYAYQDAFDLDIKIDRIINQFSVYGDPNSTSADSSDWDECFITDRISKAEFKRKYKGKADVDFEGDAWSDCEGTDWLNDDGVLIAEYWKREEVEKDILQLADGRVFSMEDIEKQPDLQVMIESGAVPVKNRRTIMAKKVTQTIMTGAEVLEENEWPGCYIPIVPVYGDEIILQGKRYFRSLIHNAKDAQRMFNYWRTTATELVALAPRVPFIGPKGFADSDPNWQTANSASHPFLEYDGPQPPQRQPLDVGPAGGALQEALNAADDMKAIIGMYDASLGARSNETSGRAIMARQREGDVATYHFIDNVTRAIRHTGRIIVDLIPKVYTGERIIRVLGEDGKEKNVPVNQPYQKEMEDGGVMEQGGQPDQGDMQEMQEAMMALHDLSVGKYDVVVKAGPSFTTRREEAAAQMTELLRAFPPAAPIIGPELAKNLDWPGADDIAEKLEKMTQPPEVPPEIQQQMEQGKQMLDQLQKENEALKADKSNDMQAKQADMQLQIEVEKAKIQLEREKAAAQFELKRQQIEQDKQLKLMADDGVEEIGPDGQPVMKLRADVQNEAIMQGLTMIAQLVAQSAQQNNDKLEAVAQLIAAPTVLERDAQGRPVAARKVIN